MKLIYLKEGRHYTAEGLAICVQNQLEDTSATAAGGDNPNKTDATLFEQSFFERLPESINKEFDKSVVKGKNGVFAFHYVGLYDYVDEETGKNLTFFFLPKFLNVKDGDEAGEDDQVKDDETWKPNGDNLESWKECYESFENNGRDILIQAIDRYAKDDTEIVDQVEVSEKKHRGILELAVRFLRDYLEKGLYIVQRHELELNGQGEIDWQTTIDEFQPVIKNGRPYYMDVTTEQAYSDEDHYITRLQKCLVTTWGRKLEELGLSSVLRVNVPLLSEEEPDQLGDEDFQIAQINRELNVQFITKSCETLALMKEIIQRSAENKAANYESLSFGMTGVHALWEKACAKVLGSELDKKISECGMKGKRDNKTFGEYMPKPVWRNLNSSESDSCSKESGWRPDFIRTWETEENGRKLLVILDAKYYCVLWKDGKICGQPGIADIAKQMFYQQAFEELRTENNVDIVNAFLFPALEECDEQSPKTGEVVSVGWPESNEWACKFEDVNLFTVRIPGIPLLERYAKYTVDDVWFEAIVAAAPKNAAVPKNDE